MRQLVVQLSRLVEISVTLNSTLDLDRLLQFIISSAADLLGCEAASILLVDENTQDLYFSAATDRNPEELRGIPVPLEGSIAGRIFRENQPLIINEVGREPNHFTEVSERVHFEVRSLIGVPLRIQEEVTGVLEAINKQGASFDEADLQTLTNIASQAAVAIHNARMVDALTKAYDELGKLDKLKSEFIAIASHELRTPLGLILGNAAILKEEADVASSEFAEAILSAAVRMRVLVEDMTNMNMLQVGTAELALELQPLQSVAQKAYDEVAELAHAKGQSLTLNLPEVKLQAMVDQAKVVMALRNLLNNAMRFTPTDGHIWVDLEQHGNEGWLSVRDDGIGIPADQAERIFDQFYQVESHLTRHHDGLGLGLAIVKAVAEAHGGRVWVESEGPATGGTFIIALPLVG